MSCADSETSPDIEVCCTACDSATCVPEPFYYRWHGKKYGLLRCSACSHQFVHPAITESDQAEIYSDQYFSADGDWVCGHFEGSYEDSENSLREEARAVLGYLPTRGGKLLDVGCAGGVFLDEARRAGFEVAGIELNASQAQAARDRFGVPVVTERIEDVAHSHWEDYFDVVTVLDCLEHLPQPLEAVRKISRWMQSGGHLLIRGPLSNSVLAAFRSSLRRAVGIPMLLPGYPLDANMFNKRSLSAMLDVVGIDVVDWIDTTADFSNLLARKR